MPVFCEDNLSPVVQRFARNIEEILIFSKASNY
jgi:hypothetical protein